MMEIFDVTETDPSLLVKDQFDYDLDSSKIRFTSSTFFLYLDTEKENTYIFRSSLESSRLRHASAPSCFTRHPSIDAISPNIVPSRVLNIEQQIMSPLESVSPPQPEVHVHGKLVS